MGMITPPPIDPVDWLVVREYSFNGVKVLVKIDRKERTVTLVDFDQNSQTYKTKKWMFANRTYGYVRSWVTIIDAMKQAVEAGLAELEIIERDITEREVRMHFALNEADKKPQPKDFDDV